MFQCCMLLAKRIQAMLRMEVYLIEWRNRDVKFDFQNRNGQSQKI